MTSPLNPVLYQLLEAELGEIVVAHPGIAASVKYGTGPFLSSDKMKMELLDAGEYYRVCCPYCGDNRHRLWINHRWGVYDTITKTKNLWLAVCYNEDCLSVPGQVNQLCDRVYGFKNANMRNRVMTILPGKVEDQTLKAVTPPGVIAPLSSINKISSYVDSRSWDRVFLERDLGVGVCTQAEDDYFLAGGRIYIPIVMNKILVGWQCRYPADIDWKANRVIKYYNKPNMPRRLMLYNYDIAIRFPYVVVTEGPTDVWNVGPDAVAGFGKHLSFQQLKLLCDNWPEGIVILLDGDAWLDTEKLVARLKALEYKGKIMPIRLPVDVDPGSLPCERNRRYINDALIEADFDPSKEREDSYVISDAGNGIQLFNELDRLRNGS